MSTQQINKTTHSNGGLGGNALLVFDGDCTKAKEWLRRFRIYWLANKTKEQFAIPEMRVGMALSYITGHKVDAWAEEQAEKIFKDTARGVASNDKILWTDFVSNFEKAYTDLGDETRAFQQLHQLKMQGGDLETYNAEFNCLVPLTGYTVNKKGTEELYKQGLNRNLLQSILDHYTK